MVDCNEWKMQYYLNNNKIGNEIKIDNSRTYHVVFTAWNGYQIDYKIVETNFIVKMCKDSQ